MPTTLHIDCIANSDTDLGPEVSLWECPCKACTKMDWEAQDDERGTLKAHRIDNWPDHY